MHDYDSWTHCVLSVFAKGEHILLDKWKVIKQNSLKLYPNLSNISEQKLYLNLDHKHDTRANSQYYMYNTYNVQLYVVNK